MQYSRSLPFETCTDAQSSTVGSTSGMVGQMARRGSWSHPKVTALLAVIHRRWQCSRWSQSVWHRTATMSQPRWRRHPGRVATVQSELQSRANSCRVVCFPWDSQDYLIPGTEVTSKFETGRRVLTDGHRPPVRAQYSGCGSVSGRRFHPTADQSLPVMKPLIQQLRCRTTQSGRFSPGFAAEP
jgi:hypothetical protein